MKIFSRKRNIAIIFSVVMLIVPLYFSYVSIPEWIERYENGAPIGWEIDVTTQTPVGKLIQEEHSESGIEIVHEWMVFLTEEKTYTPETLPEEMAFNLALTEKHYDGVEFRNFVDSILGTSGDAVEIFTQMQFLIPLIGSILSGSQSILTAFRNDKKPGFWFYEYSYIVVIRIKKEIILQY